MVVVSVVFGGGNRIEWAALPAPLRTWVEGRLGSPVVETHSAPGGFTPGFASRVVSSSGTEVFVKAISASITPDGPAIYRREIQIASALPAAAPAPRLLWSYDDGEWIAAGFEYVRGRNPDVREPAELDAVLDAITRLGESLTPSPIQAPRLVEMCRDDFAGWRTLSADGVSDGLPAFGADVASAVARLARREEAWESAADGDSLLHGDLRPDNMVLTPRGEVVVVDWPQACLGASWADLVLILPSLAMLGVSPQKVVTEHPLTRDVPAGDLDALVVAAAGFFVHKSLLPAPPGLPTLRQFQRDQGRAAIEWLRQRMVL